MSSLTLQLVLLLVQLVLLYFLVQKSITAIYTALYRVTRSTTAANIGLAILFFPGTVLHELSHFFAAIILFLRVREIHLLPEWDHSSIKLGHVTYVRGDFIRGILVGIAPIFAGLLFFAVLFSWNLLPPTSIVSGMLIGYVIFTVSSTMFSSKQDLVDLMYGVPLVIVISFVLYIFPSLREFLADVLFGFIQNQEQSIVAFLTSVNTITFLSVVIHAIIPTVFRAIRLS